MEWTPGGSGDDIEDRRDEGGGGGGGGGGFGFGGFGGLHLGVGGTIVVIVLSVILRSNLFTGGSPAATHVPDTARDATRGFAACFAQEVGGRPRPGPGWAGVHPHDERNSNAPGRLRIAHPARPVALTSLGVPGCPMVRLSRLQWA